MSLTVLDVQNEVHHGSIMVNPNVTPGVNGEFVVLTVIFEAGAQTDLRAASSAPTNASASIPDLNINTITGDVTFSYFNTGDYDQHSEVNIADLTPIAVNFSAAGPFDPATAESVIDGDGNVFAHLDASHPIFVKLLGVVA